MDEEQRLRHNYKQTIIALTEAVKLMSHYAELLNMHDGGMRKVFRSNDEWLIRLIETDTIKPFEGE